MTAAARCDHQEPRTFAWLRDVVELCKPDSVYTCDGSAEDYAKMCDLSVEHGTFTKLNEALRPDCYPGPLSPQRRRPGRRSHLHLHDEAG